MTVHDPDCDCDTLGCQLRRKGITISPKATPNRRNAIPPRRQEPPNYNKQIRGEDRGGGTFMPYLNGDGSPIRQKQFESQRHKLTDIRRSQRAAATQEG